MNRIFSFLFIIFVSASVIAGPYEDSRKAGIAAFNKGNYEYALKCFESVLRIAPANNDLAVWINKCKTKIEIKKKQEQERRRREEEERSTYFTISSDSACFDAKAGSKTFSVSSSHPWVVQRYPENWGHLSVTGNTITLSVDTNLGWPRTDYFLVSSELKTLRVGFSQDERMPIDVSVEPTYSVGTPDVMLDSIKVRHNYLMITERRYGMQFSMKLHNNIINLDSCLIVIYFYDSEGEPLKDNNYRYYAGGNVALAKTFYRSNASPTINCDLSIPYEELHLPCIGKKAIKYTIILWDMSGKAPKEILRSPQFVTIFNYPCNVLFSNSVSTSNTIEGTSREYTNNAVALKWIRENIQEIGTCRNGVITTEMGIAILNDSDFVDSGSIHYKLRGKMAKMQMEKKLSEITSIAMTNSGYYCVTYGGNSWYGFVPEEMSNKLDEYYRRGETIYCVSISENGSYAIVGNKTSYASNPVFMSIMEKAVNRFGRIEDVCITDLGICLICQKGIYYYNIPSNLEKDIKEITVKPNELGIKDGKMPDHIRFTDSGTFLITHEQGNTWRICM